MNTGWAGSPQYRERGEDGQFGDQEGDDTPAVQRPSRGYRPWSGPVPLRRLPADEAPQEMQRLHLPGDEPAPRRVYPEDRQRQPEPYFRHQDERQTRPVDDRRQPDEAPEEVELVADDGGPIAELLLHYAINSEPELGNIYQDLFQTLRPNMKLQVCCPNEESAQAFVQHWGAAAVGAGREVQVINVNRPITVWARDRRICRQTDDGKPAPSFIPSAHATYDIEKQNDLVLSSLLWPTGLVPPTTIESFHLEGGNVVSNRRHVFVGANAFADNAHRFETPTDLFESLTELFGRPCLAIQSGDGTVPWIHTDMYLTPVDTRTILVASPVEGCALLAGQGTIPALVRERPMDLPFDQIDFRSPVQQRFDAVARQLQQAGYEVIRVPALINVERDWMVTYNNVLMDYRDGRRTVYLPRYHIPRLDEAAEQIYRALGFEVYTVDVSSIFHLGGTIRCLANVTQRLPFEARRQEYATRSLGRLQVFDVTHAATRSRILTGHRR